MAAKRVLSPEEEDLDNAIAIVGLALKFPQDADSLEGFWRLMEDKRNTMTEVPKDRFDVDDNYYPHRRSGLPIRGGHFMKRDLTKFDADFFAANAQEAVVIDPMQRILLETTFHAFESAGLTMESLQRSRTSVVTGCFSQDYQNHLMKDPEQMPAYTAIGGTLSMLANRVSWFYNLNGPSFNIDCACSSSAIAVEETCHMLRSGRSDIGVVAGCNLILDPAFTRMLSDMSMLSPDSHSFAFDERANGYSRGEGVGVVILKPVKKALADNDMIRAVIRATGSNQDGHTPAITHPSAKAQVKLIRDTYEAHGLSMGPTRYFEAHGTGTPAGDPTECKAIANAFQTTRTPEDPIYVSSAKSNIGHLEGAAGIAGLIKAVLTLERGIILPNAKLNNVSKKIDTKDSVLAFPTECTPWPSSEGTQSIRRLSLSSFGYGGTNCHIILDDAASFLSHRGLAGHSRTQNDPDERSDILATLEASPRLENGTHVTPSPPKLLVWSANDRHSLETLLTTWQSSWKHRDRKQKNIDMNGLAYTLDSRRSLFDWRSFVVAAQQSDLHDLPAVASTPIAKSSDRPHIAFVFTGQGAQWYAMGRDLYQFEPFRRVIERAERAILQLGSGWSVKEKLLDPQSAAESDIDQPEFSQPLCTILQVALVELLDRAGVTPRAVIGHSGGEIAAAYCSGSISMESAFKIAFMRGRSLSKIGQKTHIDGGMVAIGMSPADTQPLLDDVNCRYPQEELPLAISCINSPKSVTVSGEVAQLQGLCDMLQRDKGVFARKLHVNVAYHSKQMDIIQHDYLKSLGAIEPGSKTGHTSFVSSVSVNEATDDELCCPRYWVRNLLSPVQFSGAVERVCRDFDLTETLDGSHRSAIVVNTIIEVGPHSALALPVRQTLQTLPRAGDVSYLSSQDRQKSATQALFELFGQLFCAGYSGLNIRSINEAFNEPTKHERKLVETPSYAFNHTKSFWYDNIYARNRKHFRQPVPLLGARVPDWNPLQPHFRYILRLEETSWLEGHKIRDQITFPAAALISIVVSAVKQLVEAPEDIAALVIRKIYFENAIVLHDDSEKATKAELRLCMREIFSENVSVRSRWEFQFFYVEDTSWTQSCSGNVEVQLHDNCDGEPIDSHTNLANDVHPGEGSNAISLQSYYAKMEDSGYSFTAGFKSIVRGTHNSSYSIAASIEGNSAADHDAEFNQHAIHPIPLDGIVQASLLAASNGGTEHIPLQVPKFIDYLYISADGLNGTLAGPFDVQCYLVSRTTQSNHFRTSAFNQTGSTVLHMRGVEFSILTPQSDEQIQLPICGCVYELEKVPDVDLMPPQVLRKWIGARSSQMPAYIEEDDNSKALRHHIISHLAMVVNTYKEKYVAQESEHIRKYLCWATKQIEQAGVNERPCQKPIDLELLQKDPRTRFYVKVIEKLQDIISGKLSALQVFSDRDITEAQVSLSELSSHWPKLEKYIRHKAIKNPAMKILEIGAGSGLSTTHLLKGLCIESHKGQEMLFERYDFSDISGKFFDHAKDRFPESIKRMNFCTLNINSDFSSQGFEDGTFDMVVASNVLHAAADLPKAIERIRKVLKLGGKLIIHEPTSLTSLAINAISGLLPAWWNRSDSSGEGPILKEEQWADLLSQAQGFSGVDICLPDFEDESNHTMSIMSTTAVDIGADDTTVARLTILADAKLTSSPLLNDLRSRLAAGSGPTVCTHAVTFANEEAFEDTSNSLVICLLDQHEPFLGNLTRTKLESLKNLFAQATRILWVARGASATADPRTRLIDGLVRTVRIEYPDLHINVLHLDHAADQASIISNIAHVAESCLANPKQFAEDYDAVDDTFRFSRIHHTELISQGIEQVLCKRKTFAVQLSQADPVMLSGSSLGKFMRVHSTTGPSLTSDGIGVEDVDVAVQEIGLTNLDLAIGLGASSHKPNVQSVLGYQGAGVVTAAGSDSNYTPGDRVLLWSPVGLRTQTRISASRVRRVPAAMALGAAACLPCDHLCAMLLVKTIARLGPADQVLVRGASNLPTWATVEACAQNAKTVYVWPRDVDMEKLLLKRKLPNVIILDKVNPYGDLQVRQPDKVDNIFDLLPKSMGDLHSLASEYARIYYVLSPRGVVRAKMDLIDVPNGITIQIIEHASMIQRALKSETLLGQPIMPDDKFVAPEVLTRAHHFTSADLISIFESSLHERHFQTVVSLPSDATVNLVEPYKIPCSLDPTAAYVISGGFGALGRAVATWMSDRGARILIFLSRSGPRTTEARQLVEKLKGQGVDIDVLLCDVADEASLSRALDGLGKKRASIKGCVQAAGVLNDALFAHTTLDSWDNTLRPKVAGSWNLHALLPRNLEFFILTSSVMGILGSASQANYAAANTYQDALAHYRIAHGEKAVSLNLGALLTGGMMTEAFVEKNVYKGPFHGITEEELRALLDTMCDPALRAEELKDPRIVVGLRSPRECVAQGHSTHEGMQSPLWALLQPHARERALHSSPHSSDSLSLSSILPSSSTATPADTARAIAQAIAQKLADILSVPVDKIRIEEPFHANGADSLSALQLQNWLKQVFKTEIPIFEILRGATIVDTAGRVGREMKE